ncbi:hypothetical protein HK101_009069, partial [Irineochytrium annulatum]
GLIASPEDPASGPVFIGGPGAGDGLGGAPAFLAVQGGAEEAAAMTTAAAFNPFSGASRVTQQSLLAAAVGVVGMPAPQESAKKYLIPPGKVFSHEEIDRILTAEGSRFELETLEIRGVALKYVDRSKYYKNAPRDMRMLLRLSLMNAEKDFVVLNNERMNFQQHHDRAAAMAHALIKLGVKKGDRVAVLMRNAPEWIVTFWAAICAGAVIVPINGWLKPAEIEYCLLDSGARVLVVDIERLKPLLPLIPSMRTSAKGVLETIILARSDKVDDAVKRVGAVRLMRDVEGVGKKLYEEAGDLPELEIDGDDDCTLLYTSGTTGRPKGAQGTHINFLSQLFSAATSPIRASLRAGQGLEEPADPAPPVDPQPACVLGVPLFHATGSHGVMGGALVAGWKIVLMDRWDPEGALRLVERERVSIVGGVPALLWQMIEHPNFGKYDLSTVTHFFTGGAPMAPELLGQVKKFKNISFGANSYGLTETSALACSNNGADLQRKPDSVGRPTLLNEFRIVATGGSHDTTELPRGQIGEIAIKGPNVVKGYWNKPDATKKSFTVDGWFLTGDIGKMDEEGFVYVLDRAKDMLIRGGENIYCVEVEDCIFSHPAVMDCGVVGLPHKVLGEEVAAAVQIKPLFKGKVKPSDIMEHCRERIAKFKCPVYVELRDEPLPRNANGKIVKGVLREEVLKRAKGQGFAKL